MMKINGPTHVSNKSNALFIKSTKDSDPTEDFAFICRGGNGCNTHFGGIGIEFSGLIIR
jgi:hypothetical protein